MRPTRDGKRRRGSQAGPVRMRKVEGGYALRVDGRDVAVFDPAECLKVGRHYGRLGIVYEVRRSGGEVDRDGNWHGTVRGLVEWGGGDWEDLARACARHALRMAGVRSPSDQTLRKVIERWGTPGLWKSMLEGLELGRELEAVSEVMGS